MKASFLRIVVFLSLLLMGYSFISPRISSSIRLCGLYAHHPQKKTIQKIMHRRPKKHRPSDIDRRNVNLNKCINHFPNAPPDFEVVSEEEFLELQAANKTSLGWLQGDPDSEWITVEEVGPVLPTTKEPLPIGGIQKKPRLGRSGLI